MMSGRGTNGLHNYQPRGLYAGEPIVRPPFVAYNHDLQVLQLRCRSCGTLSTYIHELEGRDHCDACPTPQRRRKDVAA